MYNFNGKTYEHKGYYTYKSETGPEVMEAYERAKKENDKYLMAYYREVYVNYICGLYRRIYYY